MRAARGSARAAVLIRSLSLALFLTLPLSLSFTGPAGAKENWNVADPGAPCDTLDFETSEGTWISVDVSPDGKTLAFDLLGDIYTMPIEGGEARCISSGLPFEIQPRWSPDGTRILFTSDRGGGDNLWTMAPDGSDRRPLTNEDYRLVNNGAWHPSGEYVVGRKHFTSHRSMGAGEMWLYRYPEGGAGVRLTERRNDQQDAGEPEFSPHGRYLYWSEDMSPGGHFEYNKDPNGTIYVIRRLEPATGEVRDLIRIAGGAFRPQASPDGKSLAFVRRVRTKTVLCLFDLATGEIRPLWDGLDEDQQETWAVFGVYSGFDWTPDGRALVVSAHGRLWRVDARSGTPTEIPFRAHVRQAVAQAVRFPIEAGGESFPVKVIRWPQVTPDGKTVVFQALGHLYTRSLSAKAGPPHRITDRSDTYEFAPALTPDGKSVVYITWHDREGGRIRRVDLDGRNDRILVDVPGQYACASLSPDGRHLVYQKVGGDTFRGRLWDEEPGIYLLDRTAARAGSSGRQPTAEHPFPGRTGRLLTREGNRPSFSADGSRIFLRWREGEKRALVSIDLLGSDRRVHALSERAVDFRLSPDGRWLAFEELWQSYLTPFPLWGKPIEVGPEMKSLPVVRLSTDAGTYLAWSADSKTVTWSLGPDMWSARVDSVVAEAARKRAGRTEEKDQAEPSENAGDEEAKKAESAARGIACAVRIPLGWDEPVDIPETDLYLAGARILPMDDLSVIEDGVVHVRGNRIAEVGTRAEVEIPAGARVLDLTGRTITPGFIDVHAHVWSPDDGIYPQQDWALLANLAFGVTTIFDPSNDTQMIHAAAELVRRGDMLGPRIWSTGTILYGAEGDEKTVINSYEDALSAVRRTAAWGAPAVKSYNQPRREQRQMVIKACRALGILDIPEGGSTLSIDMTLLLDGHTTQEHPVPVAPLYEPELRLLGRFGTGYTPTLIVGYGGLWGENYWYQHTRVWENERLLRFVPRTIVDPRSRRRTMAPEAEYHHFALARTAAEALRRGGNVEVGAHGQLQGLGYHWEVWMLAQGGLSPHEALRSATWMGARALGLDHALGSVRAGKLADLVILDGDPLADIRQSEEIAYTMVNGRLYNARTLEEIEPVRKPLPPGPFLEGMTAEDAGAGCLPVEGRAER